jgi:hypothetical protein
MQRGTEPRYRRIISYSKDAARRLRMVAGAPPRDKSARKGRIGEIDRDGTPTASSPSRQLANLVRLKPSGNGNSDANGKAPLGQRNQFARITRHD